MSRDSNLPEKEGLVAEGLHSDNEELFQPPNTYRDGRNMRLISNGADNFSLVSIKGNKLSFSLEQDGFQPIGWCVLQDIDANNVSDSTVVVLSTATTGEPGGPGEIGTVVFDEKGEGTYTPRYHHDDINFTKTHPIIRECRTIRENDNIKRVYWTDNYNKPRVLNFASLNRVDSGDLVNGTQYMVVKGVITDTAVTYGPGEAAGTVFTKTGAFSGYSASDIIVPYINIELLDLQPFKDGASIVFNRNVTGGLLAGAYQYAYRLRSSEGYVTQWGPLSRPVHAGVGSAGSTAQDYQAFEGGGSTIRTANGNRITISNIDQNYDEIEVVSVFATSKNTTTGGVIFFRGDITGTSMDIDHLGDEDLGTVTIDELNDSSNVLQKVRSIETNFNRFFPANTQSNEELGDFDPSGATITPFIKEFLTDELGDAGSGSSPPMLWGHDSATQTFQIKRYNGNSGNVFQDIDITNDFEDYKSEAIAKHFKGYMRGETYRIGFLPFDKEGNPMFVRWIGDVAIPEQRDNSSYSETWEIISHSTPNTNIRVCGLEISGLDITDIKDDISGFCIVRAPRDKQRIAQGMLYPMVEDTGASPIEDRPMAINQIGFDNYWQQNNPTDGRTLNTYLFHSPDHLFSVGGYVDFPVTANQDKIRLENYYNHAYGAGRTGTQDAAERHFYQKMFVETTGDKAKGSEETIEDFTIAAFGATVTNYLETGRDFINKTETDSAATDDSGAGIANVTSVGGPSLIMKISGTESIFSGFGDYNNSGGLDTAKPLCSIITPKGALYGGTSDAAKANTVYMFAGHFQEINDTILVDIESGGNYVFNNVEVFGGDTFICLMDYVRTIKDNYKEDSGGGNEYSHKIVFPVETEINVGLREGRTLARDGSFNYQAGPSIENPDGVAFTTSVGGTPDEGPSQPEQFIYNSAYSQDESTVLYPALPVNFTDNNEHPVRVHYSNEKVVGEEVDSWRTIPVNNFKDLEIQNGEITNVRLNTGRMYYWQVSGIGYLPVNERVVVGDVLGGATQLGVGGVIERFDERTRYYGNQNTHGLVDLPNGFVWFDFDRRAFMDLKVSGQLNELNVVKGLHRFFHDQLRGDIVKNDNPILNQGIVGEYDPRFKETLLVFKAQEPSIAGGTSYEVDDVRGYGGFNYICISGYTTGGSPDPDPGTNSTNWQLLGQSEFTVGYLDTRQVYSNIYDFAPNILIRAKNDLYIGTDGTKETIKASTLYSVGDVLTDGNGNYVNILSFTTGGSPTNPSADPTHWTLVNSINDIFVHRRGDICKFFGVVQNSSVKLIYNVGRNKFKVFDTFRLIGNEYFFTNANYATEDQSVSELNIDQLYKFQNDEWRYGLPLVKFGRLRGHFLEVELIKDNRNNGDPTDSTNEDTQLTSLNIGFRLSK